MGGGAYANRTVAIVNAAKGAITACEEKTFCQKEEKYKHIDL